MVIRVKKKRKYLGARRWGAGNIKNRRGAGGRGGVGRAGKKHKFTRIVKYEKERLQTMGFTPWRRTILKEINLDAVSKIALKTGKEKPTIELDGYKVLGDGKLTVPAQIKASSFSKKAAERISAAGGEAVSLGS